MKIRPILKRIISVAISMVLVLSVWLGPLPEDFFALKVEAAGLDFALSKSELALGANVIPKSLASNDTFMKRYVKTTGNTLSLNSNFVKTGVTANVKGAGDTLSTGTLSPSSSSKYWIAQYKWNPNAEARAMLNSPNYDFVYEGTLVPNKHNHFIGDDHWNDAYVTLRTKEWDGSSDYGWEDTGTVMGKSTQRNNRVTVNVKETMDISLAQDGFLTYTAKHLGGQSCGGPKVSGSVFYFVENTAPKINNIYLSANADGSGSFDYYNKFGDKDSITAYVVLEFSEEIRMADNYKNKDEFTLDLEAYYGAESGYTENSNCNLTAKLVEVDGNSMIFEFSVPAKMNGKNTNIYITGIKNSQSFNREWDLTLYQGDGSEFTTSGLKASSRITDIAGNSLNWSASNKGMGTYYFDNVYPTLKSINMTGSMITANSTKEPTDWEANSTDRGSTFAGKGDKLGFQVYFSEAVSNARNLVAVLSVADASGNPIKLEVNHVSGKCVTFNDFTITEEMKAAGERIVITGFENTGTISDYSGNKVVTNLTQNILSPNQQIYLDVDKPFISTSLNDAEEGEAADGIYETNNEAVGGECFSFPLKFKEDTTQADSPYYSMINDRPVYFSVETPNDAIHFEWYVDNNQISEDSKFVNNGTTASVAGQAKYKALEKVSDDVQYYLHIRLDSDNDYSDIGANVESDGVYFNGTLHLYAEDWAGNTATNSFAVKHQVDTEAPTGGVDKNLQAGVNYDTGTVTFTGDIWAKDNYGLETLTYTWHYRFKDENGDWQSWQESTPVTLNAADMGGSLVEAYKEKLQFSYTFDTSEDAEKRAGEFYLKMAYQDIPGKSGETVSQTVAFDFRKPTGNYYINTGSLDNPLTKPYIELSDAMSTSEITNQHARTLVFFRAPSNGICYVYDPMRYTSTEGGYVEYYSSGNILDALYDFIEGKPSVPLPYTYGTWYILGYENDDILSGDCCGATLVTSHTDILEDIGNVYDKVDVTFVTANFTGSFEYTQGQIGYEHDVFDFEPGAANVETYTMYMGYGADYDIAIQSVKDADGQDVSGLLDYSEYSDSNTYPTLDNVAVTFRVANLSDVPETATTKYGFAALDYSKSRIELRYCGTDQNYEENESPKKVWELAKTADGVQTIVFDEGLADASGWYELAIYVTNLNGEEFKETQYYFIDRTELDFSIDTYYKNYAYGSEDVLIRDGKTGSLYDFSAETQANSEIILSLAETPNSWKQDTYLKFSRSTRGDGMDYALEENIKIRVRNATYDALDGTVDTSALWVDASAHGWRQTDLSGETLDRDRMHYYYVPVLVDGYQEGAYGTATADSTSYSSTKLTLPMLDGYNLLVYEIENTNGLVTSYEVPVFVYGEAEEWTLDYSMDMHQGNIRSVTVGPVVPSNLGLEGCSFYHGPSLENGVIEDSYTLYNDVNTAFFLLDQNGNLSEQRLALRDENGELLDVDGVAPDPVSVLNGYSDYDGQNYCFTVEGYDGDSLISAKDLTITFDKDYSAVLMGLTGADRANNEEQITISVPLAVDEDGNYLKNEDGSYAAWEEYEVGNYGIYRTQILEENTATEEDWYTGNLSVKVWGTWKYDEEQVGGMIDVDGDGTAETDVPEYWSLTFNVADIYGNVTSDSTRMNGSYGSFSNDGYWLRTGRLDEYGDLIWGELDEDAVLGVVADVPLASIHSYGAGDVQEVFSAGQSERGFFTKAPMVVSDGDYVFRVTDLFGEEYDLDLYVTDFGELGVDVVFSTTEPTNEPVTVMATATGNVEKITSIVSSNQDVGTIDSQDEANASITVQDNCTVTITTSSVKEDGSYVKRDVKVTNIDKKVDDTRVEFYDYSYALLNGNETEVEGEVTVYLRCDTEEIYTTNGPDNYTFPEGSNAGDSYTFEYMDVAGNVDTYTVVLPFDIVPIPPAPDTEAPDVLVTMYGMRNNKSEYLTDLFNPTDEAEDGNAGGRLLSDAIGGYKAQQFRFVLSITDASDTKVLVRSSGAAAPTDYNAVVAGSEVDFVTVSASKSAATLTITENGTFDVYVIDSNNNISSITGIAIEDIDKEAPELYAKYEMDTDSSTGMPMVIATFLPVVPAEEFDLIIPITENVLSKTVTLETGEQSPATRDVVRYYTCFNQNGEFTFDYRDEYGNLGQVVASIKGMDTSAAIVNAVIWYGTVGNVLPSKSPVVNRDVTVELDMNKPISDVELYVYNEQMENNTGELLDAEAPIEVTFTGTNIYVTYTDNVDYQIVVQFTASASGRKGYHILPKVECIDKNAPVVTVIGNPVLSADKRSATITFRTDEAAVLSQKAEEGFQTEHVWIATTNEAKELCFTDKAGNQTVYTVKDLGIDESYLQIMYSASSDGSNATEEPMEDLQLDVGATFYIKLNKAASVVLDGASMGDIGADTWTAMRLSDEPGLHIIRFTDKNTGDSVFGLVAVQPKDNIAPVIQLESNTVIVDEGADTNEMLAAVRDGVTVTDDVDSVVDFAVDGYPDSVTAGLYSLEYTAQDTAGNSTTVYRSLYIMAEGTPVLWINDTPGLPYGKVVLENGENIALKLENMMQGEPVIVKYRSGIKTSGQMKYNATVVENMTFSVSEPGHYTIYVRSQDRVEYVTYIYVEDK